MRSRMSGYTLVELMVVMSISVIVLALSLPLFAQKIRQHRFEAFVARFNGQLMLARSYAQIAETSVLLTFNENGSSLYRCVVEKNDHDTFLLFEEPLNPTGFANLGNRLPAMNLLHPTSSRTLSDPLRSTHGNRIIFSTQGSSSGTLVFSDDEGRTFCVVLSGQTGRFRTFLWDKPRQQWRVVY